MVGVNQFQVKEELTLERLSVDPAIEVAQREKLKALRENERSEDVVERVAWQVEVRRARDREPDAALHRMRGERHHARREICNTLRKVWGEYVAQGF